MIKEIDVQYLKSEIKALYDYVKRPAFNFNVVNTMIEELKNNINRIKKGIKQDE